jgi:hypothetical protein
LNILPVKTKLGNAVNYVTLTGAGLVGLHQSLMPAAMLAAAFTDMK